MEYITSLNRAKEKIISLYPEFKHSNFIEDNSGWANYVVKVDNLFIFRFSRNEESYKAIVNEFNILKSLREKLPKYIQVPNYKYFDLKNEPFVGYEIIRGEFLTRELYNNLSIKKRESLANSIALFLNILHSLDYSKFNVDYFDAIPFYKKAYGNFKSICFKYFDDELKKATNKLFEDYFNDPKMVNYKSVVIHGDLSDNHILITKDGIGVIDFGDVRVFDPAYDLIWTYDYDKKLYKEIIAKYTEAIDENIEYRIENFYFKRTPYYGDEINDKELINTEVKKLRERLLK